MEIKKVAVRAETKAANKYSIVGRVTNSTER
jgi:hypothetical protein